MDKKKNIKILTEVSEPLDALFLIEIQALFHQIYVFFPLDFVWISILNEVIMTSKRIPIHAILFPKLFFRKLVIVVELYKWKLTDGSCCDGLKV